MAVLFKYRNALLSSEFNQRFADLLGLNILYGFYLTKGNGEFDISLFSNEDPTNLLFTKGGARIEEPQTISNVAATTPNNLSIVRKDTLYLKYIHGTLDVTVEYVVVPGLPDGNPAPVKNPLTHTLLGYISVPPNGAGLSETDFEHPNRGFHLKHVANETVFKEIIEFRKGLTLPEPESGRFATNKDYVDLWIENTLATLRKEDREVLEFSIRSLNHDDALKVYVDTELRRPNGTLHAKSTLSGKDANNDYKILTLRYYDATGTNNIRTEVWNLTYDTFGNLVERNRV